MGVGNLAHFTHTIARGLKPVQGAQSPVPPHFNHCMLCVHKNYLLAYLIVYALFFFLVFLVPRYDLHAK